MTSENVLDLFRCFNRNGITVWIDGGWGVDALLGRQTREHEDLDIAVERKDNAQLRRLLEEIGYIEEKRFDSSEFMYVLKNKAGKNIDIHVFEYDENGQNIYGILYPLGSLTGRGKIDGYEVNCIDQKFMLQFKTGYEPKEKDIQDVQALCEHFGFELPIRYTKRMNFMILETQRLILRPLTFSDAETAFYGWTGDLEVAEYVSWLPHHSIDDTINWLKEIEWKQDDAGNMTPNNNYIWGFVLKETGELFGSGGLIWEEGCQLYQVGYNIMKSHWNSGYTTEAMRAILRYAVRNLGIKRVAGGHAKENLASAKVIEKLGFVYDGDDVTSHVNGIRHFDSRKYYLDLEPEKPSNLAQNIDKIHTTPKGAERIKRNLNLQTDDVVLWCKDTTKDADIIIKQGKNWYVYGGGAVITINAHSFTAVTAHKINAKVRVMRESDYECLPEFLYQAIYVPEGVDPPPRNVINDPEIFLYINDFGTQQGDLGAVAEQNGQVIGAAWTRIIPAYGHIDSETPELAISIMPEFRSYGIGTKLMKKLFEVLRQNGYGQTSLSVQKNNPAVRFYQRLEYKMSGDRIDHAGHEDYLMIKYL